MQPTDELTQGTGSSTVVTHCQVCGSEDLTSSLFLGYLPPVNQVREIGARPHEQPAYPAELLLCNQCSLVQIGLVVDPHVLFPPDYPYTSGTTKILHQNFTELHAECLELFGLEPDDLIVDIGSNDGTLLSKFKAGGHRVHGIEPTDAADLAVAADIPTLKAYISSESANALLDEVGAARVITATNCFAHIEDIHSVVSAIMNLLADDGVFVTESHYLMSLLETVQYDTVYHEHLRYYSLTSLQHLLAMNGLEVVHAKRIPTHGGSIRVYAARKGAMTPRSSVREILDEETEKGGMASQLAAFRDQVAASKYELLAMIAGIKDAGQRIVGISAPSRASTLVNYVGIDESMMDCVLEIPGSRKIGKNMPGTVIPVVDEALLFDEQPDFALLLAWHIGDELASKLRASGYKGQFIIPLPEPRVI